MTESWHEGMAPFMRALEYVGTLAGAVSGIRLACRKRFDWFGAYVIGFVTAVGGGTLRDVMLLRHPFWMTDGSYVLTTVVALAAVWLFGRRFIGGQVTWFVFDTVAISVFMVIGMEKTIVVFEAEAPGVDCAWWVAVAMGVITAVFGGVLRDICINEVPLIFRKEIYAMACVAGGMLWYVLYWCGVDDPFVRYIAAVLLVFVIRALAIKYHLGMPVFTGRGHHFPTHNHHHPERPEKKKDNE